MIFEAITHPVEFSYFIDEIDTPSTFDQLRTTSAGNKIRILVEHLVMNVTNPALINALLSGLPRFFHGMSLIDSQHFEMALLYPGS